MKKNIAGFLFFVLVSIFLASNLYADSWYVCLGSYKKFSLAVDFAKNLNEKKIEAAIVKWPLNENEFLYRVVLNEKFDTKEQSQLCKNLLEQDAATIELALNDLWCVNFPELKLCEQEKPEKTVEVVKKASKNEPVEVVKEVVKEVPVEVVKEVVKEVPVEVIKEVEVVKEVPVEIFSEVEVIKEVPVEVVKKVEVVKEVIKKVPVEVVKEVPVEIIKEVLVEKVIEIENKSPATLTGNTK